MEFIKRKLLQRNSKKQNSKQYAVIQTNKIVKKEKANNYKVSEIQPGTSGITKKNNNSVEGTDKSNKKETNIKKDDHEKVDNKTIQLKTYSNNKITKKGRGRKKSQRGNAKTKSNVVTNNKNIAENFAGIENNEHSDYKKNNIIVEADDFTPTEVLTENHGNVNSPFDIDKDTLVETADRNMMIPKFDGEFGEMIFDTENDKDYGVEELLKNVNPQEWLNQDQFDYIIKDLNSDKSSDLYDFEDAIDKCIIINQNTAKKDSSNSKIKGLDATEDFKITVDNPSENDTIFISSDDGIDLNLSVPFEEMDTISLVSLQELCDDTDDIDFKCFDEDSDAGEVDKITENKISIEEPITVITDTNSLAKNEGSKLKAKEVKSPADTEYVEKDTKFAGKYSRMNMVEMDTLTILSKSSNAENYDDFACSVYNSSDFDTTREDEAKKHIESIVNYLKGDSEIAKKDTWKINVNSGWSFNVNSVNFDDISLIDLPGPSRQDNPSRNDVETPSFVEDYSYRNNHEIPQGSKFKDLFEGHDIVQPTQVMYENKALPDMQYEGIGFDMQALRYDVDDDDENGVDDGYGGFKIEADDSVKKILAMYAEDNEKRKPKY